MEPEIRYNRFKDAEWFGENKSILIGGVGGTGSWLSVLLARTGDHEFYIYDDDEFETHNAAGQFVQNDQIGLSKVQACENNIKSFAGENVEINTFRSRYTKDSPSNPIAFACFDNMEGRRVMYERWKEYLSEEEDKSQFLFVDLRLLAENLTIFFVQGDKPEQFEQYEANLFLDSEVADAECTLKQTSHSAALNASLTTAYFTNWVANKKQGVEYREVPFRTDFSIPANLFENEY